jgi:phospholipase/carboxylesterase
VPDPLSLVHLVRQPARPADGRPPLLLLLHGVGSNEQDLFGLAPYLDARLLIVSARAPIALGPGAFGWFPISFTPEGIVHDPAAAERSRALLVAFLDELVDAYGVDPARRYLGGFSQGAIMSLAVALMGPERIAGVLAMSGRLPEEALAARAPDEALRGLPVLLQHGVYDQVLPIELGRAARDALAALPVELEYREYPMAHQVSDQSLRDAVEWVSSRLDTLK